MHDLRHIIYLNDRRADTMRPRPDIRAQRAAARPLDEILGPTEIVGGLVNQSRLARPLNEILGPTEVVGSIPPEGVPGKGYRQLR